ncbi:hypothetical protein CMO93_04340 [Candidatus Woesearchaeota archaeon]|nr:hypothetical protein [Candidatus Woesearchaeota archaeon]|tara:strand:- start:590 stop:1105 length:516 start_codon:yes stop_codon:yes gene_type:complete
MKKSKTYKLIIVISILAILVSSLTIGRQIYLDREPSLVSFSAIHFAGYLFFMLMPVEILFTYYIVEDFDISILFIVALITAIVAEIIDYLIGYLVSSQVIHNMIGDRRYKKANKYIDKYGGLGVFVFNLFPLSSSVLSLAAGIVRYRFRNFVIYSFAGLLAKYTILIFLFF